MNLLPCQAVTSEDKIEIKLIRRFPITIRTQQIASTLVEYGGHRDLIFGVHPEDVLVNSEAIPESMPVEVYSFEPLGAETIVELTPGKDEAGRDVILKARTEPTLDVQIGQSLWMTFVPERIHFFDASSSQAIC